MNARERERARRVKRRGRVVRRGEERIGEGRGGEGRGGAGGDNAVVRRAARGGRSTVHCSLGREEKKYRKRDVVFVGHDDAGDAGDTGDVDPMGMGIGGGVGGRLHA